MVGFRCQVRRNRDEALNFRFSVLVSVYDGDSNDSYDILGHIRMHVTTGKDS
jgi:hypothetical protein